MNTETTTPHPLAERLLTAARLRYGVVFPDVETFAARLLVEIFERDDDEERLMYDADSDALASIVADLDVRRGAPAPRHPGRLLTPQRGGERPGIEPRLCGRRGSCSAAAVEVVDGTCPRGQGRMEVVMFPYSFTGLTAELFAEARRLKVPVKSAGPRPGEIWVSLSNTWRVAPRAAMPLLVGVVDVAGAEKVASDLGAVLRELTRAELDDAELLIFRASTDGGGRCR